MAPENAIQKIRYFDKKTLIEHISLNNWIFHEAKKNHRIEWFGHLLSAIRILNFRVPAQKTASTYTNNPTGAIQDAPAVAEIPYLN